MNICNIGIDLIINKKDIWAIFMSYIITLQRSFLSLYLELHCCCCNFVSKLNGWSCCFEGQMVILADTGPLNCVRYMKNIGMYAGNAKCDHQGSIHKNMPSKKNISCPNVANFGSTFNTFSLNVTSFLASHYLTLKRANVNPHQMGFLDLYERTCPTKSFMLLVQQSS